MNGKSDVTWTIIHIIFFWFYLLFFIEYRIPCLFCYPSSRIRKVDQEDNDEFFGKDESDLELYDQEVDEDGESSEVPQIISNDGEKFQIRFHAKQEPQRELAYKI